MGLFTRHTGKIIIKIDDFFDKVEDGLLIFREAIKCYLNNNTDLFQDYLNRIDKLESEADKKQRSIENDMIIHSILPQHRSEVAMLIDETDDLIDTVKEIIFQFDVEIPSFPESLYDSILHLTEASVSTCEELIPALRAFFREPHNVQEKLNRVYFFEGETDSIANKIKKKIFHDMPQLSLAEKSHLRYFTHHIERLSDRGQGVADLLLSLSMRIIM
jgi:predicted phosphate transport protein (TIGR00153 family)